MVTHLCIFAINLAYVFFFPHTSLGSIYGILLCALVRQVSFSILLPLVTGTPLQYSCLENPMDGGAW